MNKTERNRAGLNKEIRNPELGIIFFENPTHVAADFLEKHRQKTTAMLNELDLTIKITLSVNANSDTDTVVRRLQETRPDLLLCTFTSWVEEYLPLRVLKSLQIPIFLWSIPHGTAHSLLSGITATASNLRQMGKLYFYGVGSMDSNALFQEIHACTLAAFLRQQMQQIRIGLFGQNCPGMIDVGGDDMVLAALGPEVIRYELSDLTQVYDQISEDLAERSLPGLVENVGGGVEPGQEALVRSARMHLALVEKIKQERLDMVGVRCWPELRAECKVHPCLAFSNLMDKGIMGICENDPTSGVTMWLCYHASAEAVFLADMGRINRSDGTLSLCHCGVASTQLAEDQQSVQIRRYALDPKGGICIEFPLKQGPVTLAKLMRPQRGRFSMFLAQGESVEGPEHRGSVIYVKPVSGVDRFISTMIEEGVEHHITVGYGDLIAPLARWCQLMGIRVISP